MFCDTGSKVKWLPPILLLVLAPAAAQNPSPDFRDTAVIPSFRKLDPQMAHFTTFVRAPVDDRHDLLLIRGVAQSPLSSDFWWNRGDQLGLFLQERENPDLVYELAVLLNDELGCLVKVLRVTGSELVLSRQTEKTNRLENLKFFYDVRSKRLLRQAKYRPFAVARIVPKNGVPQFIAGDGKQLLVVRPTGEAGGFEGLPEQPAQAVVAPLPVRVWTTPSETFRELDREPRQPVQFGPGARFILGQESEKPPEERWSRILERSNGKTQWFSLPQSTYDEFARARPKRVRDGYRRDGATISEEIGPCQVVGDHLWFGKTFYDAEGMTGVGGFGYFDPGTRSFTLFSPPEISDRSVSALLVEDDAVWMGLVHRGEYGGFGGGLLRWDRASQKAERDELDSIVNAITRHRGRLYLATEDGIAVLTDGQFQGYVVDVSLGGAYQVQPR
jgi:hypothetical protein